jgi:hypothetical protein
MEDKTEHFLYIQTYHNDSSCLEKSSLKLDNSVNYGPPTTGGAVDNAAATVTDYAPTDYCIVTGGGTSKRFSTSQSIEYPSTIGMLSKYYDYSDSGCSEERFAGYSFYSLEMSVKCTLEVTSGYYSRKVYDSSAVSLTVELYNTSSCTGNVIYTSTFDYSKSITHNGTCYLATQDYFNTTEVSATTGRMIYYHR